MFSRHSCSAPDAQACEAARGGGRGVPDTVTPARRLCRPFCCAGGAPSRGNPTDPVWLRSLGALPGGGVPANSLRRLLIPPSGGGVPVALCGCAGGARPPGERTPPTPFGCVCRACPPWGWGRAPTPCGCARGARPPEIPLARRPLSVCGRRFQAPQPQPRVPSSGAGRSRFCPEGRRGDRARRGSGRRASPARSGWLGDSGWPGFCTRRREVRVRARPARTRGAPSPAVGPVRLCFQSPGAAFLPRARLAPRVSGQERGASSFPGCSAVPET